MKLTTLFIIFITALIVLAPVIASTAGIGGEAGDGDGGNPLINGGSVTNIGLQNPLRSDSICGLLKEIIKYMIWFAAPIYVGVVLYGAYQMLFAMGEPEKFKQGRTTILYATIAYAIVIIGWGFVNIVSNFLGAKSVICS